LTLDVRVPSSGQAFVGGPSLELEPARDARDSRASGSGSSTKTWSLPLVRDELDAGVGRVGVGSGAGIGPRVDFFVASPRTLRFGGAVVAGAEEASDELGMEAEAITPAIIRFWKSRCRVCRRSSGLAERAIPSR
jgi:hypothetical protein